MKKKGKIDASLRKRLPNNIETKEFLGHADLGPHLYTLGETLVMVEQHQDYSFGFNNYDGNFLQFFKAQNGKWLLEISDDFPPDQDPSEIYTFTDLTLDHLKKVLEKFWEDPQFCSHIKQIVYGEKELYIYPDSDPTLKYYDPNVIRDYIPFSTEIDFNIESIPIESEEEEEEITIEDHDTLIRKAITDEEVLNILIELYDKNPSYKPSLPQTKPLITHMVLGIKEEDPSRAYLHLNNCFAIKQELEQRLSKTELELELTPDDLMLFHADDNQYNYYRRRRLRLRKEISNIEVLVMLYDAHVKEKLALLALVNLNEKIIEEERERKAEKEDFIREVIDRVKKELE